MENENDIDITNPRSYLNKRVKVVGFESSHGYNDDETIKILSLGRMQNGRQTFRAVNKQGSRYNIYDVDFELIGETARDIRRELAEVNDRKFILDLKLEFLQERNVDEIDSEDFKIFAITKFMNEDTPIREKAKKLTLIAAEDEW